MPLPLHATVLDDTAEFSTAMLRPEPLFHIPAWSVPILLVCAGWLLFGWRVGHRGLWSAHEGRAAQNAQNILDTGNWVVPRLFTDDIELQKPPLYYWLVALFSAPEGQVRSTTVRAPSTYSAIVGLVLIFFLGRRMWDVETGIAAAVILATCTRYAWVARVGRIDMPLAILCLGAMMLAWKHLSAGENSKPVSWWLYVLAGTGLLLKGPVAVILILLPIGTYLLVSKTKCIPFVQTGWQETWKQWRFVPGCLLACAIAAPWFIYANMQSDGAYFWRFFVYHNLDRAFGTSEALKSGPVWFYIPRLIVDSFPWCLLFGPLTLALWRKRERIRQASDVSAQTYLFLLCWFFSHFAFFSLVSFKRADYLLPAFSPLALLIAGWLRDRFHMFEKKLAQQPVRNPRRRNRTILITAYLLAMVTAPLLIWAIIEFLKKGVVKSILKLDLVSDHLNETDRFMMYHLERLIRENWPLLGISMVVIVACLWVFHTGWHTRRNRWILAGIAGPWLVTYLFHVHVLLPPLDQLRDMARFAETIRAVVPPNRPIHYFGKFDDDLVFYAGKPARLIGDWDKLAELGQSAEPRFVVMKAEHLEWVRKDPRMANWILVADNQLAGTQHRQPRVLLTNHSRAIATRDQEVK